MLTDKTPAELREIALRAPRFLSIACTRLAEAKDYLASGDKTMAAQYLEAAKVAYRRAQEVEADQVKRCLRTADVIESSV